MRSRTVATAAALGFAYLMTSVYGQRAPRRATPARAVPAARGEPVPIRKDSIPKSRTPGRPKFLAQTAPTPPTPWVTVISGLTLDANTRTLYQQMANLVSGFTAVPNDRVNYYSAVINDIANWTGSLTSVQSTAQGGYVVTVLVVGEVAEDKLYGSSGCLITDYSEIHNLDANNNVTYAGFTDPDGLAGARPANSIN